MQEDERKRLTFGGLMDYIFPTALVLTIGWLIKINMDNNALLATLVERTGNQSRSIEAERQDRLAADKFLQSELDAVRTPAATATTR